MRRRGGLIGRTRMLPAGFLAVSLICFAAADQSGNQIAKPSTPAAPFRFHENRLPRRAEMYYKAFWGIDSLGVKTIESGELIRFSWRVLDPDKAKPLNDKRFEPSLIDPQAGVQLVVPSLEKVGQLRQSSTPLPGRQYWMAFSNKGRIVKPGARVTVVIGRFRAEGLVVQ